MANSFFKFKEFTIHQDQCGMKVTTDGCLFGALIVEYVHKNIAPAKILDIGTGTGLLSLMLAQASDSLIDAVEIDEPAYLQARTNFAASPWAERLHALHSSFEGFCLQKTATTEPTSLRTPGSQYDLIVCNPPFFSQHLTGKSDAKNKAVHDEGNLLKTLPKGIDGLLTQNGMCFVLLPDYEMSVFSSDMSQSGLFQQKEIIVYHKAGKPVFRRVVAFGRTESEVLEREQLYIHAEDAPYCERFTQLLQPYYLHL